MTGRRAQQTEARIYRCARQTTEIAFPFADKQVHASNVIKYTIHPVYITCFLPDVTLKLLQDSVTPQHMKPSGLELQDFENLISHIA